MNYVVLIGDNILGCIAIGPLDVQQLSIILKRVSGNLTIIPIKSYKEAVDGTART